MHASGKRLASNAVDGAKSEGLAGISLRADDPGSCDMVVMTTNVEGSRTASIRATGAETAPEAGFISRYTPPHTQCRMQSPLSSARHSLRTIDARRSAL